MSDIRWGGLMSDIRGGGLVPTKISKSQNFPKKKSSPKIQNFEKSCRLSVYWWFVYWHCVLAEYGSTFFFFFKSKGGKGEAHKKRLSRISESQKKS